MEQFNNLQKKKLQKLLNRIFLNRPNSTQRQKQKQKHKYKLCWLGRIWVFVIYCSHILASRCLVIFFYYTKKKSEKSKARLGSSQRVLGQTS